MRDLNPEAPTFPPTLGELTKRLKAWRNKLQARGGRLWGCWLAVFWRPGF